MDATTTPSKLPTGKEANLFKQAAAEEAAKQEQGEHDRKVDLLISPKGHQRLRAFGFEVVHTGEESLEASTSDRRSL